MCFSANASFIAGSVLATTGVLTLRKVKSPKHILFAAIPLIFSVQQFTEGFVWLSLSDPGGQAWRSIPITIFLFFAHVAWPVWVPLSVFTLEKNPQRGKILLGMLLIGIAVSAYLG